VSTVGSRQVPLRGGEILDEPRHCQLLSTALLHGVKTLWLNSLLHNVQQVEGLVQRDRVETWLKIASNYSALSRLVGIKQRANTNIYRRFGKYYSRYLMV
jgi:tryptophan 2,3-dioxygenase